MNKAPVKILVVDDEPDLELLVMQKFRRRIRAGELDFAFARDGIEAIESLSDYPDIQVVITDIRMPRMDGLSLLAGLKRFTRLLRAVVVSAYGDMQNIRAAMNLGAYDFVTKPIDFQYLEKTIDKTIEDITRISEVDLKRRTAERAQLALSHYVSPNLASHLADHPDDIELGGERRELSFVCTDMASYTPFIENSEATTAVAVMNEYISGLCEIVLRHDGTIDTVVGDALVAMFGAPVSQPDHAQRALACALELDEFATAFQQSKNSQGLDVGTTRIGVHTGPAVVGNLGGDVYFHYTAQGDAIVTAARLENANKHLGTRICVSEATVSQIHEFSGRPVGELRLKGRNNAIRAFEPAHHYPAAHIDAYRRAYTLMDEHAPEATRAFAALVGAQEDDALSRFHLQRLLSGRQGVEVDIAMLEQTANSV